MRDNKNITAPPEFIVCIVEDDQPLNQMIASHMEISGFENVRSFVSGEDFMGFVKSNNVSVVIQDFDLPGMNGLEVIKQTKALNPDIEFIFLSGQHKIEVAIEAIKEGAFDYVVKDTFAKENVLNKIQQLLRIRKLEKQGGFLSRGIIWAAAFLLASWAFVVLYLMITRQ